MRAVLGLLTSGGIAHRADDNRNMCALLWLLTVDTRRRWLQQRCRRTCEKWLQLLRLALMPLTGRVMTCTLSGKRLQRRGTPHFLWPTATLCFA